MSLSFFVCIFAKNGVSCLKRKKGTALTIQKKKVIGYSLFTIFLWASAYPLTKIAQTHFTVVPLAFLRSFIAGSFMLFIGKFQGMALPKKKQIPLFLKTTILIIIIAPPINVPAFGTSCRMIKPMMVESSGVTNMKFVTSLVRSA